MGDGQKRSARTVRRRTPPRVRARRRALVVVDSPDEAASNRSIELDAKTANCILGRDGDEHGRVEDDRMSRRHARVTYDEAGGYAIEDLGATNGTYLNGAPIRGRVPLEPNAVVAVGDTLLVLDVEPPRDSLPSARDVDGSAVPNIVGDSLAAEAHRRALATAAPTDKSIVLLGGTGTGKDVSARAIHQLSGRDGAFVAVNCAAIPEQLAEAELFGHTEGAFTGAQKARDGYLVTAHGGTLFLDEVADLPAALQAKLLRVLEDGIVQPVGGGPAREVDLRIVAATHKAIESVGFRKDLLARLGDWVFRIPDLAARRVDILTLWDHFLPSGRERTTPEAKEALLLYDWPANVRELAKLAGRVDSLAGADAIVDLDVLPETLQALVGERVEQDDVSEYDGPDIELIRTALTASQGNVKLAAQKNGWHRTQLYRWMRRARIDASEFR